MTAFTRSDPVRIDWPGTDLHGRAATVDRQVQMRADGQYCTGVAIRLDEELPSGLLHTVVRADRLTPAEDGDMR